MKDKMKLKPINNNVVVKRDAEPRRTASGLFMGDSEEKQQTGVVMAVGEGKFSSTGIRIAMNVNVGDKVFLPDYAGIDLGDDLLLFNEDQIIGVFE